MLPRHHDVEDALQDVFVRVYTSLRASNRDVTLRPWLYRAAHNRCIDELRRPSSASSEAMTEMPAPATQDPVAQVVQRESLERVLEDIGRLPVQQRSALVMRELGGANYADIAVALGTSISAVKSLLVRARMTLASSLEARDTACATIREELTLAHDRRVRPNATARRHLRECAGCREFRQEVRGASRQLAGLAPALGPLGVIANALGFGGAGSGASAGGGAAVVGGGGALASAGALSGGHVATLLAAAVATTGGAVAIQNTVMPASHPAQQAPAAVSSPPPRVQPVGSGAPSRTPATAPVAVKPQPKPAPPTAPTTGSGTSSPSAHAPASSTGTGPVPQPATTGIAAVSTPNSTVTSAIGHTSIIGTAVIGAARRLTTHRAGGATRSSKPSNSAKPAGHGSQRGAAKSPQLTSSGSSRGSSGSSSSPGSPAWGTTGTAAVSHPVS
jgi:RNA polymerase sigma factor (sigma-70 family)